MRRRLEKVTESFGGKKSGKAEKQKIDQKKGRNLGKKEDHVTPEIPEV